MAIFETFSKRMKKLETAGKQDVYQYNTIPHPFRVQVIHIWVSALGPYIERGMYDYSEIPFSNEIWNKVHDTMAREIGVFSLADKTDNSFVQCQHFIQNAKTEHIIDLIEITFRWIENLNGLNDYQRERTNIRQLPNDAINELNHRFKEHNIGYQFSHGEIIRVDSQFLHSEVVKPAISLFNESGFRGVSEEFFKAHEHYRHGRYKESINEALKSFESTMKVICDKNKWNYPPNATSKALIDIIIKNKLIPEELNSHYTSLRATLEAGLPTVRNNSSGHGQGAEPIKIPDYLAAYALHLTATNIVFLIEAHKAKS